MDRNRLMLLAKAKLKMAQDQGDQPQEDQGQGLTPENPQGMTFTPDQPSKPQTSALEAFGRGAANAVPFQNEISGAIEKGIGSIGAPEAYQDKSISDLSQENRDINTQASSEHPFAFGAGKIGGQVALSAVPGLVAEQAGLKGAQGLSTAADLLNIAKNPITASTLQGAITGASEAGPDNRTVGALTGGLAGGVTAGVFKTFSNLKGIGEAMQRNAAESSAATIGLSKNAILNKGEDDMVKIGQMLLDDNVTGNSAKLATVAKKIESNSNIENSLLNANYKIMDQRVPTEALPTVEDVTKNLKSMFMSGNFPDKKAAAIATRKIEALTTKFDPTARLKPSELRELAQTLEDISGKYAKSTVPVEQSATGMLQDAASLVRRHINDLASNVSPDFQTAFSANSARSGLYATARDGIEARLAERFQPTKDLAGGIKKALGSITSQPVKGAYQKAVNSAGKTISSLGGSEDWISANVSRLGKFGKPLLDAARRGPAASAATHYVLMQTNPDYREKFSKMAEEDESQ